MKTIAHVNRIARRKAKRIAKTQEKLRLWTKYAAQRQTLSSAHAIYLMELTNKLERLQS